ncbi:hypothetical protein FCJ61_23755 [Burkholderia metallica]|uniref:hypothetical protein n=1 Tax=Burkholderia metallica TaxID=488729 RepID=UPI0015768816|nr:hypothetical protein [Burkholderia metallica]NTZ06450.1 hypothetical protein [Burkholderia metallica]NTZ85934.1 hypothetical protein [Burkholderia metallica]
MFVSTQPLQRLRKPLVREIRNVEAAIRGRMIGLFGGMLSCLFAFNTGVQFMGYYVAVLSVQAIAKLF